MQEPEYVTPRDVRMAMNRIFRMRVALERGALYQGPVTYNLPPEGSMGEAERAPYVAFATWAHGKVYAP